MRHALVTTALTLFLVSCTEPGAEPGMLEPSLAKAPSGPSDASASFTLPASGDLRGDGLFENQYTHGKCAVNARIFYGNGGNDGVMQTDNPSAGDKRCAPLGSSVVPRIFNVTHAGGSQTGTAINVFNLGGVTLSTGRLQRQFGLSLKGGPCYRLQFGHSTNGGDKVWVERTGPSSWRVYNDELSGRSAKCVDGNLNVLAEYQVVVDFTVRQLP